MTEGPGDIETLLKQWRINKETRQELLIAKEQYIAIDKLDHMTEDVRKKINETRSLPELNHIWDSYKGLHKNQDFIDSVNMKKKILVTPKQTPSLAM